MKKITKKIASVALAASVAASCLAQAAHAADTSAGKIHIDAIDSSVTGADRTTGNMNDKMLLSIGYSDIPEPFKDYWDNTLTNRDFLYTPEGLGTFDLRTICVFELGDDKPTKHEPGSGPFMSSHSYEELVELADNGQATLVTKLSVGRRGVTYEIKADGFGKITYPATGVSYESNRDGTVTEKKDGKEVRTLNPENKEDNAIIDALNLNWLEDGKTYVMIENSNAANSSYGYQPSVSNSTGKAWQVEFTWAGQNIDLSYDDDVRSNSTLGIPLHNEVLRSNFSFSVVDKDLQKYASQGLADITGSKFAVYNINSTATAAEGDVLKQPIAWKNDGKSTAGYVVADRNCDGVFDATEKVSYVPAYDEDDILAAYEAYLVECNKAGDYNGAKTYGAKLDDGEFIIGNVGGKPIIPVMVLEPDASGTVKTYKDAGNLGASGLPTGNYIVLQVKAGRGYYIDQDFRPIVSAGLWAGTPGDNYLDADGRGYLGYGRSYYQALANSYSETYANVESIIKNGVKGISAAVTKSPVAYCPAGKATDLSAITAESAQYYISNSGQLTSNADALTEWLKSEGPVYGDDSTGASGGKYILNPNDDRMKPVPGTSRFVAQDPVIRAGTKIYIADSDDIKSENLVAKLNLGTDGNYIIVPQGNGSLDGAKFQLKPWGDAVNRENKLYTTGVTLAKGGSYTYTARNNMLLIPEDDLPYGIYDLVQISAGPGYKISEWGIGRLLITAEDTAAAVYTDQIDEDGNIKTEGGKVVASEIAGDYKVNGHQHLINDIMSGGEVYTLDSGTAPAGTTVTVSTYNISEQYVYVDKDGDGAEERYETNKYTYKNQISGKTLTYEQLQAIISKWTPCRVSQVAVGSTVTFDGTLPYGTYLIVVTDKPAGYDVTGDFMKVDVIGGDGDNIEFETSIDDLSSMPKVSTVFMDAENGIDSIAIKSKAFLRDTVQVTNLVGGASYAIYGSVVDKSTGNLLKQGMVGYATGTAYLSTDDVKTDDSVSASASQLLAEAANFAAFSDEYVAWVFDVHDFAVAIGNQTLVNYCNAAVADGSGDAYHQAEFADNKSRITATLKYIAKGETSGDAKFEGMLEADVNFDALDTRNLEGKTLVAYEYVCSDVGAANPAAMAAKTNGELMAAISSVLVTAHRSLNDENQTVYLPTLDIKAEASYTGANKIDPSETVKGTVSYGNAEIGNKYAIEAWLVDAYGAKVQITDESGSIATSLRQEFTAFAQSGEAIFEFDGLDAAKYNNQRLTVYATLYRLENNKLGSPTSYWLVEKGDADSMGYKITDPEPGKNQVDVAAPTVKTRLTDIYGRKTVSFDGTVSLTDSVTYKNLVPGGIYRAVLTLVDGEGTTLYDDEGNELTADYRFTATRPDMTISIPIRFKGTYLRGMDVIAFNDLYRQTESKIALVAQEHNVLAADQTIEATGEGYRIVVTTVASNPENNTHVVAATASASAVDDVVITNLEPATQYMAKTQLAYARNGSVITQFAPVETVFSTDEAGKAKFSVPIAFNALVFKGETLVVYQTIYDASGDVIVADHREYYDANQMLMVPDIDTVATADDAISKIIVPNEKQVNLTNDPDGKKETVYTTTILDMIRYTNLIPGNAYQITTEVVTKDGRATLSTTSSAFTPMTSSGTTSVYVDLDVTNYRGKQLVVYETVTDVYSGATVVIHKDLSDTDQTVEIMGDEPEDPEEPEDPKESEDPKDPETTDKPDNESKPGNDDPGTPNDEGKPGNGTNIDTGVDEKYALFFGIGAGALAIAAGLAIVLIRRKRKDSES